MKAVERLEDMSRVGRLRLLIQDDGDIIVAVQSQTDDGFIANGDHVEFCTSGGRSPNTLQALRDLFKAMELDNIEHSRGSVLEDERF